MLTRLPKLILKSLLIVLTQQEGIFVPALLKALGRENGA